MKTVRDLEDELRNKAKSHYEETRNIQDAHNGKWALAAVLIAVGALIAAFVKFYLYVFA